MNNEMCGCNGTCGTEEKTSTAKGIVRINYKEDFELVVALLAGDKPYQLGDEDFRIDFIVMASRYTVGRTGGVCERCAVDGNKIRCFMDAHGLPPGELRAEVKVNTPDPNYADGSRLSVSIAEGVVLLVKDNTRFDGAVIKANIPVVMVDAYQLAKAHGYKGTIDEYYATFSDVSALLESMRGVAEAERKRSEAENTRVTAEKQRNDTEVSRNKNEQQRQTNENARQKAETDRQTAEKERATAEGKRADTDKERDELVAKMQAAWQEIERMKKVREGEYGKEIELVEKIKNAAKIPTQNVWLDVTDGQIKSSPASEGINANAYKYYYIGRREVVGNDGGCTNKYLRSLDLTNWNTQALANAVNMFNGCSSLQSIDVSKWNTQALANATNMFFGCSSLQSIDVSNWNTQALANAVNMFNGCSSLQSIDVSKWNTQALANADSIFRNCSSLKSIDVSKWNTQALTSTSNMFESCSSLQSIDVSNWDTKAISNAYVMFSKCTALQSLDLSNWNMQSLTSMRGMFSGCKALRLVDFRKANFSHVKDVFLLFSGCDALVELWLPMTFDLLTSIDLNIPSWGATTEGLASLRWTFGEGADDRTAKGLQPCTVKLHANVYDKLTDNERAAAAKKGWTITK